MDQNKSKSNKDLFDLIDQIILWSEKEINESDKVELLEIQIVKLLYYATILEYTYDDNDYEKEPPSSNYKEVYKAVGRNFANFGYYNLCRYVTTSIAESDFILGDAIDDISDIIGDLQEVKWRYLNNSEDDAIWYFLNPLKFHWWNHSVDLLYYIQNYKDKM